MRWIGDMPQAAALGYVGKEGPERSGSFFDRGYIRGVYRLAVQGNTRDGFLGIKFW